MALTEYQLWHRALARLKATCEQDGIPYNLTVEYVLTLNHPKICPWVGIPIKRSQGQSTINAPALLMYSLKDGYIKGNVEIVSNLAATIRHTLTNDQLMALRPKLLAITRL
jgi:predicted acyl esterase